MFSALHAKAWRSDELRQPLDKIQQRDQLMNALLEIKGKYGADCIQAGYSSAQQEAGTALNARRSLLE